MDTNKLLDLRYSGRTTCRIVGRVIDNVLILLMVSCDEESIILSDTSFRQRSNNIDPDHVPC